MMSLVNFYVRQELHMYNVLPPPTIRGRSTYFYNLHLCMCKNPPCSTVAVIFAWHWPPKTHCISGFFPTSIRSVPRARGHGTSADGVMRTMTSGTFGMETSRRRRRRSWTAGAGAWNRTAAFPSGFAWTGSEPARLDSFWAKQRGSQRGLHASGSRVARPVHSGSEYPRRVKTSGGRQSKIPYCLHVDHDVELLWIVGN
jgi:hypothetical protein